MKVYLASPFFNGEQLEKVKMLERNLKEQGCLVFSPRNNQFSELEFGSKQWRKTVFTNDVRHINWSDIVVAIYDDEDAGTMWEIGYAYAKDIPVVVVNSKEKTMNLMVTDSLHAIIDGLDEIDNYSFERLLGNEYEGDLI